MINFMSMWAEQIVLSIVVATIIELILPQNKNKKYIQMIIGVYILFNIVSPIIENKEEISLEKYNIENYKTTSEYKIDQTSMDIRLEKIYLEELEETVMLKFEQNNIKVLKCKIDAVLDTNKKNAGIHSIEVKVKKFDDIGTIEKIKKQLAAEFEIDEKIIMIR